MKKKLSLQVKGFNIYKDNMRLRIMALVLAASAAWLAAPAQRVFDMELWQGKVKVKGSDPADTAKVRVFLPEAKNATGRAVVICPGCGYRPMAFV